MKFPDYPKKGIPIEQTFRQLENHIRTVTRPKLPGSDPQQRVWEDSKPPFYPTLFVSGEDAYAMNMTDGYVILRKSTPSSAVETILPASIPDDLTVIDGDKFTCKLIETDAGIFTSAEIIKTNGSWPTSSSPALKGGDVVTGSPGVRHIRLCEVIEEDGRTRIDIWSTGHIDHFQPTLIENTINTAYTAGGGGRWLKYFDQSTGIWKIREIEKGLGQLTITEGTSTVEARGNKTNTDLKIYIGNVLQTPTIGFEDGLITTGNTVNGDEDPAVASMQLKIKIPTVTSDDESVTITNNGGANGPIYDLSVDASDALPSGSAGDILYHNGTSWIALASPAAPAAGTRTSLIHNGTAPSWTNDDIETISVCVSGTPTNWNILKL